MVFIYLFVSDCGEDLYGGPLDGMRSMEQYLPDTGPSRSYNQHGKG